MVSGHRKKSFKKSNGKPRYQDISIAAGTVKEECPAVKKGRSMEAKKVKKEKPKTALSDTVNGFR